MKVPVPHLTPGISPDPVRVPDPVVIVYYETVLFVLFGFLKESLFSFLYHYRGMSLVLQLSKIKL